MKTALKLKRGAGQILAFLILIVVFASVAGVVFVALNNESLKPQADIVEYTNRCDLNKSGKVDSQDVEVASKSFGKVTTPEGKAADIDNNGAVNSIDLQLITINNPTKCLVGKLPNSPVVLCTFSPSDVKPGDKISVKGVTGGPYGQINIQGAFGGKVYALGDLPQSSSTTVTIPDAPSGLYALRVGSLGATCKSDMGVDLSITNPQASVPACSLAPGDVTPGGTVRVTSVNGLFGTIGMQGAFGTPIYSNLGNLTANSAVSITIPNSAQPGLYVVRVGSFGVACSPNLAVNAPAGGGPAPTANRCDFNSDGALNSADQGLMAAGYGAVTAEKNNRVYDLNGDGNVNSGDQAAFAKGMQSYPTATTYCY